MGIKSRTNHFLSDVHAVLRVNKTTFVIVWGLLFVALAAILISVGLAPEPIAELAHPTIVDAETEEHAITVDSSGVETVILDPNPTPVRVVIDAIDTDTLIESPGSRDIAVLDEALTRGAVHYPGSGDLDDVSNMFLFGHSSSLPFVQNQSYKAFNDLAKLENGDVIRVYSENKEYQYMVTSVVEVDAEQAWVQFNTDDKKLTLSTCNNFGSVQDRFVVEADFLGSYAL